MIGFKSSKNQGGGFRCSRMGSTLTLHRCTSVHEEAYTSALMGRMKLSKCVPGKTPSVVQGDDDIG